MLKRVLAILLTISLVACVKNPIDDTVHVTGITLNQTNIYLVQGVTTTITAIVSPSNATNKKVLWITGNANVATVSNGTVTAVGVGETTITAKSDDGGITSSCQVIVSARNIPVAGIKLDKSSAELIVDEELTLVATIIPSDATNKNIVWQTSDSKVASVNNGTVKALAPGSVFITAKAEEGEEQAVCEITVKEKTYPVTGITLSPTSLSLTEGETASLTATVKPENATNKSITWQSSNTDVATVDEGLITAVAPGEAVITVTTEDGGHTAKCNVSVAKKPAANAISLEGGTWLYAAKINQTFKLHVKAEPEDAHLELEWSVSDESIATISSSGSDATLVTTDFGKGIVTVKDKYSGLSLTENLQTRVYEFHWTENTGKTYDGNPLVEIEEGEVYQLHCSYSPESATRIFRKDMGGFRYNGLVNTSPEYFSIDDNGKITGIKSGLTIIETFIPVYKLEGSSPLYVRVVPKQVGIESITLNKTALTLFKGKTETLIATLAPKGLTGYTIDWSSSKPSVATVDNGVVTAVKEGTAIITAKAGDKSATCAITVVATPVTSVSLDKTSASLKAGETVTLTATVNPSDATDKTVTWSTSDATVATVSNGVVTAKEVGTATITAQAGDKSAKCVITVEATPVATVTLDKTNATLRAGQTMTLTATVSPGNATDKTVTWSTSNAAVATVTNGVVTAMKVGVATITAKAGDKTATCSITVEATPVASVTLDKTSVNLSTGQTVTLVATINPSDATDKTVTWSSSNTSIASVSDSGLVSAKSAGTATITAKANNGGNGNFTAHCTVTVTQNVIHVNKITIDNTSISGKPGDTKSLTAIVYPDNADDKSVVWFSSNESIATVSSTGIVTFIAPGETSINVKTNDGGYFATCSVYVQRISVQRISLSQVPTTMEVGETSERARVYVYPEDAYDKSVRWSSSNTAVVTVNDIGHITAVGEGTATVTVTTNDGNFSESATITVTAAITRFTVTINLPGCTISNFSTPIVKNNSYSATVTPLSNYSITSLTCTMGGVEQHIVNNSISIPAVTGDIVIKAEATNYSGGAEETVYMAWCKDDGFIPSIPINALQATTIDNVLIGTYYTEIPKDGYGFYIWAPRSVWVPAWSRAIAINGTPSSFMDLMDFHQIGFYNDFVVYQGFHHDETTPMHLYSGSTTEQFNANGVDKQKIYLAYSNASLPIPAHAIAVSPENGSLKGTIDVINPADGYSLHIWVPSGVSVPNIAESINGTSVGSTQSNDIRHIGQYAGFDIYQTYVHNENNAAEHNSGTISYMFGEASSIPEGTYTCYAGFSENANSITSNCLATQVAKNGVFSGTKQYYNQQSGYYFYIWIPKNAVGVTVPATCQMIGINGAPVSFNSTLELRFVDTINNYYVYQAFDRDGKAVRYNTDIYTFRF